MGMVGGSTNSEYRNPMIPPDSSKIFPEPRKQFVRNQIRSFLGAEHKMNEDIGIFVRHSQISTFHERVSVMNAQPRRVPSRNGTRSRPALTRHCHAGLSHIVPSALGCRISGASARC